MSEFVGWPDNAEIADVYQAISRNPRFEHYIRIPERLCACLDYFKIVYERRAVSDCLHSYYLFIGVVDDAIDSSGLRVGDDVLKQLSERAPCFNEELRNSAAGLVTEVFKCRIEAAVYPAAISVLECLYAAVVREQNSTSIDAYLRARREIGYLTAELSYLLILPYIKVVPPLLHAFLTEVGEFGCLVDSLIDLKADFRNGVLSFEPSMMNRLRLLALVIREGLQILVEHPLLAWLFLGSLRDDFHDIFRRRGSVPSNRLRLKENQEEI